MTGGVPLEVIRDGRRFPRRFERPTVALGNFDGIHLGHQALLVRLKARAAQEGGEAIVYTFDPHPITFFFPDRSPFLLTTLEQKLELIASFGIRTVVVATFDADYASQTPEVFARDVLAGGLGARAVIVGYDFTFGKGRAGTPAVLEQLGRTCGFDVEILPPVTVGGEPVSSSRIRRAVVAGAVEEAAALLGRPYAIRGRVVPGRRRGAAQLGFPTANLEPENPLIPAVGVYAAWARILPAAAGAAGRVCEPRLARTGTGNAADEPTSPAAANPAVRGGACGSPQGPRADGPQAGDSPGAGSSTRRFAAAVNVGTSPTFGGGPTIVEAHLLDFSGDLYGARLELAFVARLRDERRFADLATLKAQIAADVAAVRARLA